MRYLVKSIGATTYGPSRVYKIGGQLPSTIQALTAMPTGRRKPEDTVHRYFTPEAVVKDLPLASDWAPYLAKAMAEPTELRMRQALFSRMLEEKMDPSLRRELFARSMALWRDGGGKLSKASLYIGPRGGKWADPKHTIPYKEPEVKGVKWPDVEPVIKKMDAVELYALSLVGNFGGLQLRPGDNPGKVGEVVGRGQNLHLRLGDREASLRDLVVDGLRSLYRRGWVNFEDYGAKGGSARFVVPSEEAAMAWKAGSHSIKSKLYVYRHKGVRGGNKLEAAQDRDWSSHMRKLTTPKAKLAKAEARGGSYVRRVPKPGGGWRYFYDEDKYNSHADSHASGEQVARSRIGKAVDRQVKSAGTNGLEVKALTALVKRYGSKLVGGMLNDAVRGGSLLYRDGRLFARREGGGEAQKGKAKKSLVILPGEPMVKAGSHKYVRRTGTPGNYRYYYAESASARDAQRGETIRLGDKMAKVFREYARIAAANPEGQGSMFGAKTSPMEALTQAFAGAKEPQLSLVASMSAREETF